MITERQVLEAVPPSGFLRRYIDWGCRWIETNAPFHLASALTMLAQTVPYSYASRDANPMHANVYGLLVGPSSEAGKTKTIQAARSVLALAGIEEMECPNSTEVFIDLLEERNQILLYDEFGQFLASTERGQRLSEIRPAMMKAFDCTLMSRATVAARKTGGGKIKKVKPRLSMLAGCTPGLLEDYTTTLDWIDGFLARFFSIFSTRDSARRCQDFDELCDRERQVLADELREFLAVKAEAEADPLSSADIFTPNTYCPGGGPNRQAANLWREWVDRIPSRVATAPWNVKAALNRAEGHAKKITLLLAWDTGQARSGNEWFITEDDVSAAIALTEIHIQSVTEISEGIAKSPEGRNMRAIQRVFGPHDVLTIGEIMMRLGFMLNKYHAAQAIDSLVEMRILETLEGPTYRLRSEISNVIRLQPRKREEAVPLDSKGEPLF